MNNLKICELLERYPFVELFFEENNFDISKSKNLTFTPFYINVQKKSKNVLQRKCKPIYKKIENV